MRSLLAKYRAKWRAYKSGRDSEAVRGFRVHNDTRGTALACNAERAGNYKTRRRGLLGRACLLPGHALWIAPCEAVHTIGMRFPIDLVYINRGRKVVKLVSALGPWRMSVSLAAHSVLELPAGTIAATATRKGDVLSFLE